jgi:peptidoglycan/LPS O-acetylase OafA/YrhL
VIKFVLIAFSYFSIIGFLLSVKESNLLKKLFQVKPLLFSGKISYGLYVYHPVCFGIIFYYLETSMPALNFILSFALTYIIAALSYYLFESKFLRLKKFFEYKKGKVIEVKDQVAREIGSNLHYE